MYYIILTILVSTLIEVIASLVMPYCPYSLRSFKLTVLSLQGDVLILNIICMHGHYSKCRSHLADVVIVVIVVTFCPVLFFGFALSATFCGISLS